jgi:hypothetical protein
MLLKALLNKPRKKIILQSIKKIFCVFFQYNRLDVKDSKTTNVLGITEVRMARMVNGRPVKVKKILVDHI